MSATGTVVAGTGTIASTVGVGALQAFAMTPVGLPIVITGAGVCGVIALLK